MSAARVVAQAEPQRQAPPSGVRARVKAKEAARISRSVVDLHSLTSIVADCETNQSLRSGMLMACRVRTDACG